MEYRVESFRIWVVLDAYQTVHKEELLALRLRVIIFLDLLLQNLEATREMQMQA